MAINFTELTGGFDETPGTSAATASITPTANALVLLLVTIILEGAGTPNAPTVTGNGLTWVAVDSFAPWTDGATFNGRTSIYRAMGASPSAGAVTISTGAQSNDVFLWTIIESVDTDTSGTNGSGAIVQSDNNGTNTAPSTTPSGALAAFGDATNNACVFVVGCGGVATNVTPEAGFTGFTEQDSTSYTHRGQWRLGEDTTPSATLAASRDWGTVSVEIKAAAGGGGRTTRNTRAFPLGMAVGMNWVHPGDCS